MKSILFLVGCFGLFLTGGCDEISPAGVDTAGHATPPTSLAQQYADAWSSGDPSAVAGFYSPDGQLTVNDGPPARGRAAITDVAAGFMAAFPDMTVSFDRLSAQEGRTAFHWTLTGTNSGPGGTGAFVKISGQELWLLTENGLIARSTGRFDAADYERQLALGSGLSAQDVETIRAASQAWVDAYNRNDWTALAGLFAPDAVMMPPNQPAVVGRDAIAAWERQNETGFRIAFDDLQISGSGDVAYVRGRSCVFVPLDDGAVGVDLGKYLEIRRRQADGQWPIAADIFNSDLAAGAALMAECPFSGAPTK